MGQNEASFALRTIGPLKKPMPLHERNWLQHISQVDSNCHMPKFWEEFSDTLATKDCQEIRHFVHSVQETTTTIRKAMFVVGGRVRISKYDLLFRKSYKPQFTQKVSEIDAIPCKIQNRI